MEGVQEMARNKSGGFKKFLNVLGLVDNEPADNRYDDRYDDRYAGASAGRSSTYVPRQQSRAAEPRRTQTAERSSARYSAPGRQTGYAAANEGYTVRRTERAYVDDFDAPKAAPKAEPRRETAPRYDASPVPRQQSAAMAPGAARTVMFNLTSLAECGDVVNSLIKNNIVLLMMDQLDDATTQRAVDTVSGAAFALRAKIRRAADRTYLIAPSTVDVSETDVSGRRMG